eukprot:CAMPEP_0202706338 /NCGR_PEP_ID=MMETSP1385-20130828/18769_1 /ASSEMBLY_ACC=CAM_ASM_000861 /TAXON_ID=933848 /ORGANISM="Elphidium margaritaceum" /LENGTH=750 /DNA_ID=CAMNT_0049364783 /DNA_START=123 /DNA_END=2375 /DNA_ORIENTATION=-
MNYSDLDDPFGATCLSEAARRGNAEIVSLLVSKGVSVDDKISHDITALHLACERGHLSVVKALLANECEACPQELFNLDTPLHYAAANDYDSICKTLVDDGHVNVNVINKTGDTPLHVAVANDRRRATTMLLQLGGVLSLANHAGMTPIQVAQLAKCKQATLAMQPFIDAWQQQTRKEKEKLVTQRRNTIKKALVSQSDEYEATEQQDTHNDTADANMMAAAPESGDEDNDELEYKNMSLKRGDVVFKKGFQQKQGKKFKHFHERYFVLFSNGLLHYYAKEHTVFASYAEVSKPASTAASDNTMATTNSLRAPQPPSLMEDESYDQEEEEDEVDEQQQQEQEAEEEKEVVQVQLKKEDNKSKEPNLQRRSTFVRLGLKSAAIKPKGIIDINDLIETQFIEFSDNAPGWALVTPEREWKFKCKNDRDRREWIAAVHAVNYGISPYDFQHFGMNIRYQHNTMLLEPATNSFLTNHGKNNNNANAAVVMDDTSVAQGWMYKLGAAVRGLEQNYWKKRWVSLYKKPARLAYAQHPYSLADLEPDSNGSNSNKQAVIPTNDSEAKKKKSNIVKGVILLSDVTNIIRVGDAAIIKEKYRAPTVHVFALITAKRTWVFACKTAEECSMWCDRIAFFLPDSWKNDAPSVDLEEMLRLNRVKTIVNEHDAQGQDSEDDEKKEHLQVNDHQRKSRKKGNDTVMTKILRKVSNVAESLGISAEYSTISAVQPKGTIDYNDAMSMMRDDGDAGDDEDQPQNQ